MRFVPTPVEGCMVVEIEPHADERGFLARVHCADEMRAAGLEPAVAQANLARTERAGTVRGLHYQVPPFAEAKLVRCVRGGVFDVAVDLRTTSPTYLQHAGVELSDDNRRALFVPAGCAHGYQALVDGAELLYMTSAPYMPDAERGLRPDDPALGIRWPLPPTNVSAKDQGWPLVTSGWSSGIGAGSVATQS